MNTAMLAPQSGRKKTLVPEFAALMVKTDHRDEMKRLAVLERASLRCTSRERAQGAKEQPAMEYGAIDLHTKKSQVRIVREDGSVAWTGRIDTRRAAFEQVFRDRPP